jgi:predicted 3-demethylubiquinone-9 3-methyltransferase (glyoxalase superfamily)
VNLWLIVYSFQVSISIQVTTMKNLVPCLWFDRSAEEAVNFYTSIFKNSKIGNISRYTEAGHEIHGMPPGTVLTIDFELDGRAFTALNGGPMFKFTEAVSFQVHCDSQDEVDYYWSKLSQGGDESAQQCGWLKDKFGLSWQIVPTLLIELVRDKDPQKSGRVMNAILQMKKIDIATLRKAYNQQ